MSEKRRSPVPANLAAWPVAIEGYLRAHAWKPSEQLRHAVVWTKARGRGSGAEVIIPSGHDIPDFELRVNDALDTLARLEGISVLELFALTRAQQWDTTKLRLSGPEFADSTAPLTSLLRLFNGAKDAVLAAACSAALTRAHFGGPKPQAALRHLSRVRVAQTEVGSYVVNVESPAWSDEGGQQAPLSAHLAPMPYPRRSSVFLARALGRLEALTQGAELRPVEVAESVGVGVTANLSDAVAAMVAGLNEATVEVSFIWAAGVPAPSVGDRPLRFGLREQPRLQEVSQLLRGTGPANVGTITGPVVALRRRLGSAEGTATIEATVDGRSAQVQVVLPPGSYLAAIEAHGAQREVRFEGRIVRYGRRWFLENPNLVLAPRLIPDGGAA